MEIIRARGERCAEIRMKVRSSPEKRDNCERIAVCILIKRWSRKNPYLDVPNVIMELSGIKISICKTESTFFAATTVVALNRIKCNQSKD